MEVQCCFQSKISPIPIHITCKTDKPCGSSNQNSISMQIQSIQLACHQPLAQSICMDAPKYNPTLSLVGEPIVEEMPSMKNKNRKPVQKCERPRNCTIQMLPNSEHARRLKLPGETAKSATSVRLRNPIRLLRYDCEIRIPAHPCTNQCQFNY